MLLREWLRDLRYQELQGKALDRRKSHVDSAKKSFDTSKQRKDFTKTFITCWNPASSVTSLSGLRGDNAEKEMPPASSVVDWVERSREHARSIRFRKIKWEPSETDLDATVVVQRWWRRRLWRRHFAIARFQSRVRGRKARAVVRALLVRRNGAAQCLQRFARGPIAARRRTALFRTRRRHKCATLIQSGFRGCKGRAATAQLRVARRHRFATRIQTIFRGRRQKTRYEAERIYRAAVKIQCCWRGARRRQANDRDAAMHDEMAQRIKRLFRGHRGRRWGKFRVFQVRSKAALLLQRVGRGHRARCAARRRRVASISMRRSYRNFVARRAFEMSRLRAEDTIAMKVGREVLHVTKKWLLTKEGRAALKSAREGVKETKRDRRFKERTMNKADAKRSRLRWIFDTVDVNGNGTLDICEFECLLKRLCVYVPRSKFDLEWGRAVALEDRECEGGKDTNCHDRDTKASECLDASIHFESFYAWWASRSRSMYPVALLCRFKLSAIRAWKSVFDSDVSRLARRSVLVSRKIAAMRKERSAFRKRIKPPFECKKCTRTFLSKRYLRKHQKEKETRCDHESAMHPHAIYGALRRGR